MIEELPYVLLSFILVFRLMNLNCLHGYFVLSSDNWFGMNVFGNVGCYVPVCTGSVDIIIDLQFSTGPMLHTHAIIYGCTTP